MENKCTKCGGELMAGRLTTGRYFLGFTPLEDEKSSDQDMQRFFATFVFRAEAWKIFALKIRKL